MKTWKAVAVMLLGMALAGEAVHAHTRAPSALIEFVVSAHDPFQCQIRYSVEAEDLSGHVLPSAVPLAVTRLRVEIERQGDPRTGQYGGGPAYVFERTLAAPQGSDAATLDCPRFHYDYAYAVRMYGEFEVTDEIRDGLRRRNWPPNRWPLNLDWAVLWATGYGYIHSDSPYYITPPVPAPPPGEPTAAASCGHVAIVPTMPRALSGGEDAADHWIRISNPSATGITFTVDGRDRAGTKGGTYRRELPAYRSVRVGMRSLEAAFNVSKPAGWWTLTVAGTGPLYAAATMRQGDATRFVPVERPATCTTGAR